MHLQREPAIAQVSGYGRFKLHIFVRIERGDQIAWSDGAVRMHLRCPNSTALKQIVEVNLNASHDCFLFVPPVGLGTGGSKASTYRATSASFSGVLKTT